MSIHSSSSQKEARYCSLCNKEFKSHRLMQRHECSLREERTGSCQPNQLTSQCFTCNKMFANDSLIQSHQCSPLRKELPVSNESDNESCECPKCHEEFENYLCHKCPFQEGKVSGNQHSDIKACNILHADLKPSRMPLLDQQCCQCPRCHEKFLDECLMLYHKCPSLEKGTLSSFRFGEDSKKSEDENYALQFSLLSDDESDRNQKRDEETATDNLKNEIEEDTTKNTKRKMHSCHYCGLEFSTPKLLFSHNCEPSEKPGDVSATFQPTKKIKNSKNKSNAKFAELKKKQLRRKKTKDLVDTSKRWSNGKAECCKCLVCGATFTKKVHLKVHCELSHKQYQHFHCSYCEARFANKLDRSHHLLVHLNKEERERIFQKMEESKIRRERIRREDEEKLKRNCEIDEKNCSHITLPKQYAELRQCPRWVQEFYRLPE